MDKEFLEYILRLYISGAPNKDLALELARGIDYRLYSSLLRDEIRNIDFSNLDLPFEKIFQIKFINCIFVNKVFCIGVDTLQFEYCFFESCRFEKDINLQRETFKHCDVQNCTFNKIRFEPVFFKGMERLIEMSEEMDAQLSQFKDCEYELYYVFGSFSKVINRNEENEKVFQILDKYSFQEEANEDDFKGWEINNCTENYCFEIIYGSFYNCTFIDKDNFMFFCDTADRIFNVDLSGAVINEDLNSDMVLIDVIMKNSIIEGNVQIYSGILDGSFINADMENEWDAGDVLSLRNVRFGENANLLLLLRADDISGSDLEGLVLSEFDFEGKIMEDVNFRSADLSDVNFRNASLSFSDFTNAILEGADFRGADIRGAIFEGADLTDALFDDAIISESLGNKKINYFCADRPPSVLFRKSSTLRA